MAKVTVSLDEHIVKTLLVNGKDWDLLSNHSIFRLEMRNVQPSKAEVVEAALIKFIRARQD